MDGDPLHEADGANGPAPTGLKALLASGLALPTSGTRRTRHSPVDDIDRSLRISRELLAVGHDDHRSAVVGENAEDREDGGAVFGVERAGRLVDPYDARIVGERPPNLHIPDCDFPEELIAVGARDFTRTLRERCG